MESEKKIHCEIPYFKEDIKLLIMEPPLHLQIAMLLMESKASF